MNPTRTHSASFDDAPLDALLREQLEVPDAILAALRVRLLAAVRPHRARTRALSIAAITTLVAAATFLWRSDQVETTGTPLRGAGHLVAAAGDDRNDDRDGDRDGDREAWPARTTQIIPLRRDPNVSDASHYDDPRRLGNLLEAADLIVIGVVTAGPDDTSATAGVVEGDAHLQVESVLLGTLPDSDHALSIRDHDGATWFACAETLRLETGIRTAMFLVRDAGRPGRFEVLFGDAGNNPLPMEGWFDAEDLQRIIATGTVPTKRVLEWMDREGFRVVTSLPWHFFDLDGLNLPIDHSDVQRALALRFAETDLSTVDTGDLVLIVDRLAPGTFDAMPASVHQSLRDQLPRVLAGVNGPFRAIDLLRPFARRREPWAYPQVRGLLDPLVSRIAASPRADWGAAQHRDLLALLYPLDPDDAIRRAWECAARLPDDGYESRARVLDLLMDWDRERAEADVLQTARAQWARGDRVWIDLLVRSQNPPARALAREILGSPDYDPALRYAIWRPELHDAIDTYAISVADLRDTFVRRLQQPTSRLDDFIDRLLCVVSAGGDDSIRDASAPWIARRAELDRHGLRRLIRALERAHDVSILKRPVATRSEMEAWLSEWWTR